ncbi:MAG: acylphosphatase [Marmoricola sp.]
MSARALDVTVTGLVQGVFFRARCAEEADRLGVTGWVSNEYDGSVAGHFEGPPRAVEALVEWCHLGSPRSRVDAVRTRDAEVGGFTSFQAR